VEHQTPTALSTEVVDNFVVPELQEGRSIFFFVIDCLRLDQWLMMENVLQEYFEISNASTIVFSDRNPYSRNAIFSGTYPSDLNCVPLSYGR